MKYLTYNGVTKCIKDWARYTGTPYENIRWRLAHGWSVEEALYGKYDEVSKEWAKDKSKWVTRDGKSYYLVPVSQLGWKTVEKIHNILVHAERKSRLCTPTPRPEFGKAQEGFR